MSAAEDLPGTKLHRWWLPPLAVLACGLLVTIPFWATDLDLRVALALAAWDRAEADPAQQAWSWRLAYHVPAALTLLIGLGSLVAMAVGALHPAAIHLLRPGLYLLLVLVLGSGALANLVLKDHTGRPRPRETIALGGQEGYLPPWWLDSAGTGKSFPCGHATVPMLGFAGFLLWRRNRPRLARWTLVVGMALTAWIGLARMLVGAHWLSDVLWAVALMALVALLLHRLVLGEQQE